MPSAGQPIPFLLIEPEHTYFKEAYEQKVEQQHRARNALLLGDAGHLHDVTQTELTAYSHNLLPKAIFFAQKFAQLTDFVYFCDHTMRKYDMEGTLINDFYIASVRMLEYEKEEIIYRDNVVNKVDDELTEILEESYHPHATAQLRAYVAGDGYEGLMTADGRKVTMPLYWEIEAIDHDLYLCASKNSDKVIVNGKGEIVK